MTFWGKEVTFCVKSDIWVKNDISCRNIVSSKSNRIISSLFNENHESASDIEPMMNESENDIEFTMDDGVDDKKYDIGQMLKGDVEITGKKVAELDDTLKYRI